MRNITDGSLYLVITGERCAPRSVLETARSAIAGGVDIIQMREKESQEAELVKLGTELGGLCKKAGVKFVVNDDPYLAKRIDADGVHMGQEDITRCPIRQARAVLGSNRIIGISTHSYAEFEEADRENVDYVAFGPIFRTKTKGYFIGTGEVKNVLRASRKPVFFIGGIDSSNIGSLIEMGAKNIAVIGAIAEASCVEGAARKLKEEMKRDHTHKRQG